MRKEQKAEKAICGIDKKYRTGEKFFAPTSFSTPSLFNFSTFQLFNFSTLQLFNFFS